LKGSYPDFVIEGLSNPESEKINADLIIALIKHICVSQGDGAILVFVPGWEDISAILRKINEQHEFFNSCT
jgi:ATP-dependent RNA helicase DHX36